MSPIRRGKRSRQIKRVTYAYVMSELQQQQPTPPPSYGTEFQQSPTPTPTPTTTSPRPQRTDDFDYRRPLLREEERLIARGYVFPYRRRCGYDAISIPDAVSDEPEPALAATGCDDPTSAGEFLDRVGKAMPGTYFVDPPHDPNVKSRINTYNATAIHGASIRNGAAATGVITQNLVLAESWALHLLQIVGDVRGGLDKPQERAVRLAAKFLDLVGRQAEILDRLKNGHRQTVRVEKVVVEAGGQAVVGVVQPSGKGPAGGGGQP